MNSGERGSEDDAMAGRKKIREFWYLLKLLATIKQRRAIQLMRTGGAMEIMQPRRNNGRSMMGEKTRSMQPKTGLRCAGEAWAPKLAG